MTCKLLYMVFLLLPLIYCKTSRQLKGMDRICPEFILKLRATRGFMFPLNPQKKGLSVTRLLLAQPVLLHRGVKFI